MRRVLGLRWSNSIIPPGTTTDLSSIPLDLGVGVGDEPGLRIRSEALTTPHAKCRNEAPLEMDDEDAFYCRLTSAARRR